MTEASIHHLVGGSVQKALTEIGATSGKLYMVDRAAIHVIPGFNVRVHGDAYKAHVAMLAESMRQEGFKADKPLTGFIAKETDGGIETHKLYITDGHCRLAARDLASSGDSPVQPAIDKLPIVIKPATTSMEDLTVSMVTNNTGRPLDPYEISQVVKRIIALATGEGREVPLEYIANRLLVTPRYVRDLQALADGPDEIHALVRDGVLSSTLAIGLIKKAGDKPEEAAEAVERALVAAKAEGATKITAKYLKTASGAPDTTAKKARVDAASAFKRAIQHALDPKRTEDGLEDEAAVYLTKLLFGDKETVGALAKLLGVQAPSLSSVLAGKSVAAKPVKEKKVKAKAVKAAKAPKTKDVKAPKTGGAGKRGRPKKAAAAVAETSASVAAAEDIGDDI